MERRVLAQRPLSLSLPREGGGDGTALSVFGPLSRAAGEGQGEGGAA